MSYLIHSDDTSVRQALILGMGHIRVIDPEALTVILEPENLPAPKAENAPAAPHYSIR